MRKLLAITMMVGALSTGAAMAQTGAPAAAPAATGEKGRSSGQEGAGSPHRGIARLLEGSGRAETEGQAAQGVPRQVPEGGKGEGQGRHEVLRFSGLDDLPRAPSGARFSLRHRQVEMTCDPTSSGGDCENCTIELCGSTVRFSFSMKKP